MVQKEFKHFSTYFNSFITVFKNPILLLPSIYAAIMATAMSLLFTILQGRLGSINEISIILSIILIGFLYFFVITYFQSSNAASIRKFVDTSKVTHKEQMRGGLVIYWKYLGLSIIIGLITLTLIAIAALLVSLIFNPLSAGATQTTLLFFILTLLPFLLIIAFLVSFIFIYATPIITEKKSTIGQALSESYNLVKLEFKHTILTLIAMLVFSIAYMIVVYTLALPLILIEASISLASGAQSTNYMSNIFIGLLSVPIGVTSMLYIFKSKEHIKPSKK